MNALLDLNGSQKIVSLELLNPISEKEYVDEKGPILDLKARDQAGRQYNIEVQLNPGLGDYIQRSIYYLSKFYSEQIRRGDAYSELLKTISISLLDFEIFDHHQAVHSTFCLWEKDLGFALSDALELHYVELRKFSPTKPHELKTRFEKWLYFLKFSDLYHEEGACLPENLSQEEGITMALESMRRAYATDRVRALIEAREKAERDELSRLQNAVAKGIAEGKAEGKADVGRAMLAKGVPLEQVLEWTGLSEAEIVPPDRPEMEGGSFRASVRGKR